MNYTVIVLKGAVTFATIEFVSRSAAAQYVEKNKIMGDYTRANVLRDRANSQYVLAFSK